MATLEVWNRHGKRFPENRGLTEIRKILNDKLKPGTAVEGEWIRQQDTIYLFDVTFVTVKDTAIQERSLTVAEIETAMRAPIPNRDEPCVAFKPTSESAEYLQEQLENRTLSMVRQVSKIEYYYPPAPREASKAIFNYPPDDWRMELKMNGDRALLFEQPTGDYKALDIRAMGADSRREILERIVKSVADPRVQIMPSVDFGFGVQYNRWKSLDFAEGVVMKSRNSPYQGGSKKPVKVDTWAKRRYIWD